MAGTLGSRKGYTIPLILFTIMIGMGSVGYMMGVPNNLIGTLNVEINDTHPLTQAKVIEDHLTEGYIRESIWYNFYESTWEFGGQRDPSHVSNKEEVFYWDENQIPSEEAVEESFEKFSGSRFWLDYLADNPAGGSGSIDAPGDSWDSNGYNYSVVERYDNYTGVDKVDVVFVADTSASFPDEWSTLCGTIENSIDSLKEKGLDVRTGIYANANDKDYNGVNEGEGVPINGYNPNTRSFPSSMSCVDQESNYDYTSSSYYGDAIAMWDDENTDLVDYDPNKDYGLEAWGVWSKWILENHDWRSDTDRKIMFVIGDYDPTGGSDGNPDGDWRENQDGTVLDSEVEIANNVVSLANSQDVSIYTLSGNFEYSHTDNYGDSNVNDAKELMQETAASTGGEYYRYTGSMDLAESVLDVVKDQNAAINYTFQTDSPIDVSFGSGTSKNSVYLSEFVNNKSKKNRLFYMYNLTENLTSNERFRFITEGAAMNVSKVLQLKGIEEHHGTEYDYVSDAGDYGDGTNSGGGHPYNYDPDAKSLEEQFEIGSVEFEENIDAIEDKYEASISTQLEDRLDSIESRYQDPDNWVVGDLDNDLFDNFSVNIEVADLQYRVENIDKIYLDRYVTDCLKSHGQGTEFQSDSDYYKVTCSSDADDDDPCECEDKDCSCADCCSSCSKQCDSNCIDSYFDTNDVDLSCTESVINLAEDGSLSSLLNCDKDEAVVEDGLSCACEDDGLSGCSCPGYFPLNTNPPTSVKDGSSSHEPYPWDCVGEKTAYNPTRVTGQDTCELDNACNVDQEGFGVQGVGEDGTGSEYHDYSDETGRFKKCDNEGVVWSGTDNPWFLRVEDSSDYNHGNGGFPTEHVGSWNSDLFGERLFMGGYSLSEANGNIETVSLSQKPDMLGLSNRIRAGEDNGDDDSCDADCECNMSCDWEQSCECEIGVTETQKYDPAFLDEEIATTAAYTFDLRAYVKLKITVTDKRWKIPTRRGYEHPQYVVYYSHYAFSTKEESLIDPQSPEKCELSGGIDPDNLDRTVD